MYIVGEIGINHNGSLSTALQLIAMAKECGCDAVKFQMRTVDTVYTQEFLDSPRESPWGTTQRAQKEGLEFNLEEYQTIDEECSALGIEWSASAWDLGSLEFLETFDPPWHKIASAMATHRDFIEAVVATGRRTFASTGMCSVDGIEYLASRFSQNPGLLTLMHTVSLYPCPEKHLNLRMLGALAYHGNGCAVGYSGHEVATSPSLVAAVLGATVIERHITLDRSMYGSDQAASLERQGLADLVRRLRKLPAILGDGIKRTLPEEEAVAAKLRYWL